MSIEKSDKLLVDTIKKSDLTKYENLKDLLDVCIGIYKKDSSNLEYCLKISKFVKETAYALTEKNISFDDLYWERHREIKMYVSTKKEEKMTKEQVKEQFPDATDEQIKAILNINVTDLSEVSKNQIDKKELKRLQDSDAAYQKLVDADLTDAEKIQKAIGEAENAKAEYAAKTNRLEVEKIFVAAGMTEDDYKDLIDGIVSDDSEKSTNLANGLVKTISKQKETAIQKTKEELMDDTKVPGGTVGSGGGGKEKTDAEKFAETLIGESTADEKSVENIIGSYK